MQQIQQVILEQGEVFTSYDVKALFTSVPVDPSITIVKHRLTQGPTLPQRTQMSIPQIVTLLEFCLKNTYFLSKASTMNRSMVQPSVPPSALSLPTCLLRSLKSKPLALTPTPSLCLRFADGTLVIHKAEHSMQLLHHINSRTPTYSSQYTENQHILTNPYIGTATISLLLKTVYTTP